MILQQGQRMHKPGVAVFSGSGGGGALIVDSLADAGMPLAELSAESRQALRCVLPPTHCELPIDFGVLNYTAAPHPQYGNPWATAIGCTMDDDAVGAGLVLLTTQPNMDTVAKAVIQVGRQCGKPLLFIHGASTVGDIARKTLCQANYGYVESPTDAINILRSLWKRELMPINPHPAANKETSAQYAQGFMTEPEPSMPG